MPSLQQLLISSSYYHGSVEFHPVQTLRISLPEMFHTDSSETLLVFRKRKLRKFSRRASNLSVKPDSQPPKHGWGPWRTRAMDIPICGRKKESCASGLICRLSVIFYVILSLRELRLRCDFICGRCAFE